MTKNLKEIVLQQIYDILVGKENEIDKLKVLITLLQTLNGDESEGESFIKLYNKLEDEWDKIKGDSE